MHSMRGECTITRSLFGTSQIVAAKDDAIVVNVNLLAIFPAINVEPAILEGQFEIIQIDTKGLPKTLASPRI